MKYLILIFSILIILLTTCNTDRDNETYLLLQGDWSAGFEQTFMFKDTLCNYLRPFGSFTSFRIKDDTIFCKPKYPERKRLSEIKFQILSLDSDSLKLKYKNPYSNETEIMSLGKVKNKLGSNIQVDSVIYVIGVDPRWTPTTFIKVINDSSIHFRNQSGFQILDDLIILDTIKSKSNFEFIDEKFACIDYKIMEKYSTNFLKDRLQTVPQIIIYVSNKKTGYSKAFEIYNLYKDGCMIEEDDYPDELKIFISYLDNINYFIK